MALVILALALDVRLKIQYYTCQSDAIAEKLRLALLTDLHSCQYGDQEKELIEALARQEPDLVLLGGDICDDRIPNDNSEALLKAIASQYPCYYVTSNHEYWSNDIDTILKLFQAYGVTILSGTHVTVEVRGQTINICGVTDPDVTKYTNSAATVESQLAALEDVHENGYYTILLAHRPELIELYSSYSFNLVLSGHAHGGQWRIPGLVNGLYAPDQGWFPAYAGGQYAVDETSMIVSRGLARESTRVLRIFNRPELVIVDLIPA